MRQLRGFLPWITYGIAAPLVGWRGAAAAALGVAIVALLSAGREGDVDVFPPTAAVFFAACSFAGLIAPATGLHRYIGALAPAALAAAAVWSIAIHAPFTIPFAKRVAPVEFWDTPMFMQINVVLSMVWAASFAAVSAISVAVVAFRPHAGVLIAAAQVAGFLIPMRICRRYPAAVRARTLAI